MKRCPTCNRSYPDDTLSFCLEDGTRLASDYDPEATVIAQPRPPSAQPQSSNRRAYQFTILLLLLLLIPPELCAGVTPPKILPKRRCG